MAGQDKYGKRYLLADGTVIVDASGNVTAPAGANVAVQTGRRLALDGAPAETYITYDDTAGHRKIALCISTGVVGYIGESDYLIVYSDQARAWTAAQHNTPTALALAAAKITPARTGTGSGNEFTYSMASGAAEVQLPTGCAAGYRFTLDVTSNAAAALTWVAGYKWGDATATATDMTAVTSGSHVLFECRALSATQIFVMPSEAFAP